MLELWYIQRDGQSEGPLDARAMAALIRSGAIHAETRACRVGAKAWSRVRRDPTLSALLAEAGAAVPPIATPKDAPAAAAVGAPAASVGAAVASVVPSASRRPLAKPFTFGDGWRATLEGFRRSWASLLLLAVVVIAVSIPSSMVTSLPLAFVQIPEFLDPDQFMRDLLTLRNVMAWLAIAILNFVSALFVQIPIQFAGLIFAASKASSRAMNFADVFQGYRRLGMVMATGVTLSVVLSVLISLCFIVPGGLAAWVGWSWKLSPPVFLACLLGGFALSSLLSLVLAVFAIPYLFAPVVACDPAFGKPSFGECFRLSASGLKGRGLSALGLLLLVSLLLDLSLLLFCVGFLLVGVPLVFAALGAIYAVGVRAHAPQRADV
jgi:hypothetical protein